MGRAVLIALLVVLAGCAPDIAPMGVQECEMRETIESVKYLRTQTAARIERTRRLRRQWRNEAAQVDTLAAFFNGVQPVFDARIK
jgi:hypothetical protein